MMRGASGDECGNYLLRVRTQIDPEVIDPGGRSVEDTPVKRGFTFTFTFTLRKINFLV
jgi:hypothetical protein